MRRIQVADERTHQPRFAHTRGQRKAQRWKVALKVLQRAKLALQHLQHIGQLGTVALVLEHQRAGLDGAGQRLQRIGLRLAQAQAACDGVDFALAHFSVPLAAVDFERLFVVWVAGVFGLPVAARCTLADVPSRCSNGFDGANGSSGSRSSSG